jgi:uncharacterized protein
MTRFFMTVFWMATVVGTMFAIHGYLWLRLVRDTELPRWLSTGITVALVFLAVSLPLSTLIWRLLSSWGFYRAPQAFVVVSFWWIGLMFYLLVFVASFDVLQFVLERAHVLFHYDVDLSKRVFLSRTVATLAIFSAGATSVMAMRQAMAGPVVESLRVKIKRWPQKLVGFRMVQLSDLHIGPTVDAAYVQRVVDEVVALQPDLIAITGDLVDGSVDELMSRVALLKQLKAPHGVFFVTGNHEYYSGADVWCRALSQLGMRVLRNAHVSIGEGEAAFVLAGVEDASARHTPGHGSDLSKALAGRNPSHPVVLLAHQPKTIYQAAKLGVDLQLSGHTHAGQLWPFTYIVRMVQPYVQGLSRHSETTQIYVNRGTGYWGPPMRLPDRSEITLLEFEIDVA